MILHSVEIIGTLLFALAVLHSFLAPQILKFSHRYPKGSVPEACFHWLGEIEIVFGFWAAIFMLVLFLYQGKAEAIRYQESIFFAEPIFVFCIMVMAATKPIMNVAQLAVEFLVKAIKKLFKVPEVIADVFIILTVGPLLGSFITEPAAMTMTALLLNSLIKGNNKKLLYVLLAVSFVNVSIGGALTDFAAPPILMVASKWSWNLQYVFTHFGWKSILAVVANALFIVIAFKKDVLKNMQPLQHSKTRLPKWVTVTHLIFLMLLVMVSHHPSLAVGFFLLFLGLYSITQQYQEPLRVRGSLLVAFFLAGIMMFGPLQAWWISPLIEGMNAYALYIGACLLTAVTDNAALTYIGSQASINPQSEYYLVAGALAGGGLTIIANAPNAAGFSLLHKHFPDGLNPVLLLKAALIPTAIAIFFLAIPTA